MAKAGGKQAPKSKVKVSSAATQILTGGTDLQSILGPPALLEGEDASLYSALTAQMRSAVAPKDVLEEIWVRDVVDLVWEGIRLKRMKSQLMQVCAHEGLKKILDATSEFPSGEDDLIRGWARRDADDVREVNARLKEAGLKRDAIHAQTFAIHIDTFERIDRMVMQVEARRNVILREIDRHRDVLAQRLRDAVTAIEDAEFTEIANEGKGASR